MSEKNRDFPTEWQEGPTGKAPTTESAGDPDSEDVGSGAEGGAATGALLGTAVGGPVGMVVGGVIGGAAGAAGEAADEDADRGYERRDEGTGSIDPIYEEKR